MMSNNSLTTSDKDAPIVHQPTETTETTKVAIELPNLEKKEVELVLKNDEVVHRIDKKNGVNSKTKKVIYKSTDEYHGTDCGCLNFRPDWLQRLRSPKMFLLVFSILGILRSAYFSYTVACLSTIEKRYAFPSKISAIILICDNIVSLFLNPIIGYLGTKINGPKLLGFGSLLVGLSCLASAMPYFVYGTSDKLLASSSFKDSSLLGSTLNSSIDNSKFEFCDGKFDDCENNQNSFNLGAFLILSAASFLNGIGYCSFFTIGLPYLDDNTKKKNSPIYISISTVIRMFGVVLGYFLSSWFLSFYEDPSLSVNIKTNDPRWVGQWWAGFVLIGSLILVFSFPLFLFPATMNKPKKKIKGSEDLSFKDAMRMLNKLVRNPILVFDTIGGALRVIGFAGYWINKPRYVEAQFNVSASQSSFLTGATGITMQCVGILSGGIFMAKYKPKAKSLLRVIIAVEMVCNCLFIFAMFFGCNSPSFAHISYKEKQIFDLDCNQKCACSQSTFQPVCSSNGVTNYFSPCFAGCSLNHTTYNTETKSYSFGSCGCENDQMTSGYCKPKPEEECKNLPYYLIIMSSAGVISSFVRTPNIMIAIRSVTKEEKSFAFGIVASFMAIFAYIPYPIVFGFITDAACVVAEKSCGKSGNCWLYDLDLLRYYLHITPFCLFMIGGLFDILIYFYADRLNLYDEDDDLEEKPKIENSSENGGENGEIQEMKIHDNALESMDFALSSIENLRKVSEC